MLVHVVDNASTDGTPEMVREEYPEVRLHALDWNSGFCFANNVVLRQPSAPLRARAQPRHGDLPRLARPHDAADGGGPDDRHLHLPAGEARRHPRPRGEKQLPDADRRRRALDRARPPLRRPLRPVPRAGAGRARGRRGRDRQRRLHVHPQRRDRAGRRARRKLLALHGGLRLVLPLQAGGLEGRLRRPRLHASTSRGARPRTRRSAAACATTSPSTARSGASTASTTPVATRCSTSASTSRSASNWPSRSCAARSPAAASPNSGRARPPGRPRCRQRDDTRPLRS